MEETFKHQQLCVACNRLQSSNQTSCECGHVLREALTLKRENGRKRRVPFRPDSISSEWIMVSEDSDNKSSKKRKSERASPSRDQNNNGSNIKRGQKKQSSKKKINCTTTNKTSKTLKANNSKQENNGQLESTSKTDIEKQTRIRELMDLIENSYQNIYFNRCRSYKKAKLSDLDFEFDFSTFDSHNPFYPSALEDINTKINRTNRFWSSLDKVWSK